MERNKEHGLKVGVIMPINDYLDVRNANDSTDTAPSLIPVIIGDNIEIKSFASVLSGNTGAENLFGATIDTRPEANTVPIGTTFTVVATPLVIYMSNGTNWLVV